MNTMHSPVQSFRSSFPLLNPQVSPRTALYCLVLPCTADADHDMLAEVSVFEQRHLELTDNAFKKAPATATLPEQVPTLPVFHPCATIAGCCPAFEIVPGILEVGTSLMSRSCVYTSRT